MRAIRALVIRLRALFTRGRDDRDFAAELDSHLAVHVDDNVRSGMTLVEARRHALLKLGGMSPTMEQHRRRRGLPVIDDCLHDVRYAIRLLRTHPTFTVVAVGTLALGLGITTAVFTLGNWGLLRPIPGVLRPHELKLLWTGTWNPNGQSQRSAFSHKRPATRKPSPGIITMSSFAVWRFFRQSIQWRVLLPLRLSGEESAALALGFGGAVGLVRGLRSRLVGVEPFDPVLWTTAATALIGIVVIASLIPAWRAARLSIAATLRS